MLYNQAEKCVYSTYYFVSKTAKTIMVQTVTVDYKYRGGGIYKYSICLLELHFEIPITNGYLKSRE